MTCQLFYRIVNCIFIDFSILVLCQQSQRKLPTEHITSLFLLKITNENYPTLFLLENSDKIFFINFFFNYYLLIFL